MATAAPGAAGGRPPLVGLLRRAQDAYVAEFDRRLASSEFCALSLAHSRNVLRHLADGPRRASQLVDLAGVSKQAISQQLVHLERSAYIELLPDASDHRARLVALTEKGERAQSLVRATFVEIERDWAPLVGGEERLEALRTDLERLLEDVERPVDPSC